MLLPLLLAACGTSPAPPPTPAPPESSEPPTCLAWHGEPVRLSPTSDTRHHPTAAWADDALIVSWQVGKGDTSSIGVRPFDEDLQPRAEEQRVSGTDRRATHPQLAPDARSLVWTDDATGALSWRGIEPGSGAPTGPAVPVVPPGSERPGLYADVGNFEGDPVVFWYAGHDGGSPRWEVARVHEGSVVDRHPVRVRSAATAGGPGAVLSLDAPEDRPDGVLLAWPELTVADGAGTSSIRQTLYLRDPPDRAPRPLEPGIHLKGPERWERIALGLVDDGVSEPTRLTGWTRYPAAGLGWGVYVHRDGGDIHRLDDQGRMLDLAAAGPHAVVGWETPRGRAWDVVLAVLDPDTLTPRCTTTPHRRAPMLHTRAHVLVREDGEGVVIWQQGPSPRAFEVWGRRFRVTPPSD